MKNILKTLLALLIVSLFTGSCNNGTRAPEESLDEPEPLTEEMNDSIQSTFLDVKFGDSEKNVKANLLKKGIASNDGREYYPQNGKKISFGDHSWDYLLAIYNKNGKLAHIIFCKGYDDKSAALSDYDAIYSTFSKQYKFKNEDLIDTELKSAFADSRDDRFITLKCNGHKDDGIEYKNDYFVSLAFVDGALAAESESK
ncbi:MAG: hypothetical protein IKQ77_04935 [Prevotella sp.]|nr:hypothetical protein [Prevotella sp.]